MKKNNFHCLRCAYSLGLTVDLPELIKVHRMSHTASRVQQDSVIKPEFVKVNRSKMELCCFREITCTKVKYKPIPRSTVYHTTHPDNFIQEISLIKY